MGLGKTIQVISFLSGMYDADLAKHILLVMPTSLITNWTTEFAKWTPGMRVKEFHGANKAERTRNLEKVQRIGGVVITTFQMLVHNWQLLASYHGQEFKWDYMILDEAHKIKTTSTKTAKSAYAIPARNRILLTGTPVQNNLREMWALFDFACQGALLGTSKTFKAEYENPITRAREKDATPGEKALGLQISENLVAIITPYFLRRTKAEVQKKKSDEEASSKSNNKDSLVPNPQETGAVMPTLTRKNDLIVWTYLSAVQEDIYRQFLSLDHIKELLMTTRSPLAELNIMKKLCDHPRLLSAAAITQLGLERSTAENQQEDESELAAHSIANIPDETLISESGKLVFLITLLERLRQEGHRTLVFAHFRKVLDILERILGNRGFKVIRVDGTITQLAERQRRISLFQESKQYSVFLLTTQVGGVGITLTAADRVVIFDPSWNPATDAQAVDRAYRIGQTENVVIYRLITCGTVEEKIYRRQIFKNSLIRQTTGDDKNPFRYFSKQELKELFTLEETRSSSTQLQLQSLHSRNRRTDRELDEHIAHLHAMEMFGISDHDLMFSQDVNDHDEAPEDQEAQYIKGRVQKAQELMKAESELKIQLAESMASSTEPAWLRQPVQRNKNRMEYVTIVDEDDQCQNETSHLTHASKNQEFTLDEGQLPVTSLQNKRLSILQMSNGSLKPETSKVSTGLESFEGNFDLELDDSDMFPDNVMEEQETEAQERKLLSQLQMEGSFNIDKSLCERGNKEELDQSMNAVYVSESDESIVTTKKKTGAVIHDSEEDDDEDGQQLVMSEDDDSFQVLGASTPKSVPFKSQKSVGGNTSVASRHSLIQSIIEDVEDLNEDMTDEDDVSEKHSEVTEGEDGSRLSFDKLELEETNGETLNTEGEEESEDSAEASKTGVRASLLTEENEDLRLKIRELQQQVEALQLRQRFE
ncbi:DNA excision repair protein ERCC-6-like [Diretmus argenteus]